MYTHVFMLPEKHHIPTSTGMGTDSHPADTQLWPFAATGSTKGGKKQNGTKKIHP